MVNAIIALIGRTLLSSLFILGGALKMVGPKPFRAHRVEHRLPTARLPLVICLELGAGLCLMIGWQLATAAGALASFCIATAFVFHRNLADKAERTLFIKDLAIAGALMIIAAA